MTILGVVQGTFKDEDSQSYVNPVIRIQTPSFNINNANYVNIAPYGRYYWITDVVTIRTGLLEIHMHEDVIYSHANAIKSNETEVFIQESSSKALSDTMVNPGIISPGNGALVNVYPCSGKLREKGGYVLVIPGAS